MNYYFNKIVNLSFEDAVTRVKEELQKEGFGVLTEIDVKATLHKKLGVDFRNYRILGSCNPAFAYKALQAEEHIGLLMPCNIVVQETLCGTVEVSAVNPSVSMQSVQNPSLGPLATEVSSKLQRVIENLE